MKRLVGFIKRTGVMTVETGIQINGPGVEIGPGGLDAEVVKNPLTKLPYIPGSSFKGKMRSSLEKNLGKVTEAPDTKGNIVGRPCGCGSEKCIICTLFGAHLNNFSKAGAPRLKFRDMNLCDEFLDKEGISETKAATMIDRLSGTASNGTLRTIERVSAGTKFDYEIIIELYEGDNKEKFIETLDKGMMLIENSGLGGGTSRGNGKVSFTKHDEEIKL